MSPVPEQKPMIPAVYPRPSPMSSMYLYCAFQLSEEFSALETSSIAISFFFGSVRSTRAFAGTAGVRDGAGADGEAEPDGAPVDGDADGPAGAGAAPCAQMATG